MATLILIIWLSLNAIAENHQSSPGGSRAHASPHSSCTWVSTGTFKVTYVPIGSPFLIPSDSQDYVALKQEKKLSLQKKNGSTMQNLWTLEFANKVTYVQYSNDEKTVLVTTENKDRYWIDTATGQTRHSTGEKTRHETIFATHPFFHLELFQKPDSQFYVKDYATGSEILLPLDIKNFRNAAFSYDSKKIAFHLSDKVLIYDFATQKMDTIAVSSAGSAFFWTLEGELLAEKQEDNSLVKVYPGEQVKILQIPPGTTSNSYKSKPGGNFQFLLETQGQEYKILYRPTRVCLNPNQRFRIDPALIKKPDIQSLCGTPFSAQAWDAVLGKNPTAQLSSDEAQAWLYRFAKPGGLGTDVHLNLFLQLLPEAKTRWPGLVNAVLQNTAALSPLIYDYILEQNPDLKNLKNYPMGACLTQQEKNKIAEGTLDYAHTKALFNPRTKLDFWNLLNPLTSALKISPPKYRTSVIEAVGDSLSNAAAAGSFSQVPTSTLYYFIEQSVKPLFGVPLVPLTDAVMQRQQKHLEGMVLSTHPISSAVANADKPNEYGFYHIKLPELTLEKTKNQTFLNHFNWKTHNENYTANLSYVPLGSISHLIPKSGDPLAAAKQRGEPLRQVILFQDNLEKNLESDVKNHYFDYYMRQKGYRFTQENVNLPQWMEAKLSDKTHTIKPHLIIKEGHMSGNNRDVFRLTERGIVYRGIKTDPVTKKVVGEVEFVLPVGSSSRGITGRQLKKWLGNSQDPTIIVNSTCNSWPGTSQQVAQVQSPGFYAIGVDSSAVQFRAWPWETKFQLLEGLHAHYNNEQIRQLIQTQCKGYADGRCDQYVWPDQQKYQTAMSRYSDAYDWDVQIYNRNGLYEVERVLTRAKLATAPVTTEAPDDME